MDSKKKYELSDFQRQISASRPSALVKSDLSDYSGQTANSFYRISDSKAKNFDHTMALPILMYGSSCHPSRNLGMDKGSVAFSGDDSDAKSDAATSGCRDFEGEESEEENCVDEILYNKSVKKRLECLASMVGVDCTNPSQLLAEVIRVLKDLERERV